VKTVARGKLIIGAALTAAALSGGSVAASDYPPDAPPPSTVVAAASSTSGTSTDGPSHLADTGNSDTGRILEIGGAAVLAGAGLVLVARRRHRVAPT
jgi:LPXTG-motif cell wall-anchored protein